jgi:hypothetical protein
MRLNVLLTTASAFLLVAGCASAPRQPVQSAPSANAVAESPSWAANVPQDGDVQFTTVAAPKAKTVANDDAPATQLKMDSASGTDVKTTHLKAAQLKASQPAQ